MPQMRHLIWIYTVRHSSSKFLTYQEVVKWMCSNMKMNRVKNFGKTPKILNTLKNRTPNIFAQNNIRKCPKILNSSSFAKCLFLKFRTRLSFGKFLSVHSNFGNSFIVTESYLSVLINFMYKNGTGIVF